MNTEQGEMNSSKYLVVWTINSNQYLSAVPKLNTVILKKNEYF